MGEEKGTRNEQEEKIWRSAALFFAAEGGCSFLNLSSRTRSNELTILHWLANFAQASEICTLLIDWFRHSSQNLCCSGPFPLSPTPHGLHVSTALMQTILQQCTATTTTEKQIGRKRLALIGRYRWFRNEPVHIGASVNAYWWMLTQFSHVFMCLCSTELIHLSAFEPFWASTVHKFLTKCKSSEYITYLP